MGRTRIVVPCGCGRGPLPPSAWGLEQSEGYYLSSAQKELLAAWTRGVRPTSCPHPRGELAARDAADVLSLVRRLKAHVLPEDLAILSRMRSPGLDFSGDCVVLPPADAELLAGEVERILAEGRLFQLPPTAAQRHRGSSAYQERGEEERVLRDLLELAWTAAAEAQPLLIC